MSFRCIKRLKPLCFSILTLQFIVASFIYVSVRTSSIALNLNRVAQHAPANMERSHVPTSQLFLDDQNNSRIVVYNRVPKCASTSTRILLNHLRGTFPDRFNLRVESYPRIQQVLDDDAQKRLATKWNSATRPTLFIRHLHFLDFTKYNLSQPVYVNIIRDPVEQFISSYYFMRFGFEGWSDAKVKRWLGLKPDKQRYMTLEECVVQNVTDCVRHNPSKLLEYFCGHEIECSESSQWSLDRAKENVEKYFSVIGIVEEYDNTLRLLEETLPRYFFGISRVFQQMKDKGNFPKTRTARKKDPPLYVKEKLRKALRFRVEFYEYVKERFHQQLGKYKIALKT